ncbi:hypothetical protein KKG83_01395 [Candidatus Micrarchaeota archaeon]|nr:hypothetical protein [Candidatus Micrarchaeota archaeon]MBU2476103.1 hypothetical protein [Candidatus Micrarchaeota archaeon]
MTRNATIKFYIKPVQYNEKFIRSLTENLIKKESKYDAPKNLAGKKGFPATLEDQIIEESVKDTGIIDLSYKNIKYYIYMDPDAPFHCKGSKLGIISINAARGYFYQLLNTPTTEECEKNAEELIEIAKNILETLGSKALYGLGDDEDFLPMYIGDKPSEKDIIEKNLANILSNVRWLNFYGTEIAEKIGRKRLLSAPAYKIEELKSGILIVNSPLPWTYSTESQNQLDSLLKVAEHFKKTEGKNEN